MVTLHDLRTTHLSNSNYQRKSGVFRRTFLWILCKAIFEGRVLAVEIANQDGNNAVQFLVLVVQLGREYQILVRRYGVFH